jgi:hypothetical protein
MLKDIIIPEQQQKSPLKESPMVKEYREFMESNRNKI